jgi:GTP 3',8-cyclase
MTPLTDSFSRRINYLRLSVTDRCQNRCIYCMPPDGIELFRRDKILSFEEIAALVRHFTALGINRVRLTGGEPLLRRDLHHLTGMISETEGIEDLSLTTNGILLGKKIETLVSAGLQRINVSLDTLQPEKFRTICRGGELADVLTGLDLARQVISGPIKLNTVVIGGVNDDEVIDLARFAFDKGFTARFIELMPIGQAGFWSDKRFVTSTDILSTLGKEFDLRPITDKSGGGPARYFVTNDSKTEKVGVISSLSHPFCSECNRVRLSSTGRLQPCLGSPKSIDLAGPLRRGADDSEMISLIEQAISTKPDRHCLADQSLIHGENMSKIGG